MVSVDSPVSVAELESVLAWVDTFKLSRPTRKINRDFSDAVLLAEMLSIHYPKLVEMHNYPPRNSHALKLNNWMTLNRKVLKKLKLNLCINTMEQLANCAPGIIERVLVMVREKINHDEELNKTTRDAEQNVSSGGSYYEALGEDEQVLIIPVKTRVNGTLETVQQKVISYDIHTAIKEELKDAKETTEVLKQKVDHLSNMIKLKDERIDELQRQLDRKQSRRKEVESYQNSLSVPFDPESPVAKVETIVNQLASTVTETVLNKPIERSSELIKPSSHELESKENDSNVNETNDNISLHNKTSSDQIQTKISSAKINAITKTTSERSLGNLKAKSTEDSKIPVKIPSRQSISELSKEKIDPVTSIFSNSYQVKSINSKPSISEVTIDDFNKEPEFDVDRVKSDVFKEAEEMGHMDDVKKEEFQDPESGGVKMTIEETIIKEITDITQPTKLIPDYDYIN